MTAFPRGGGGHIDLVYLWVDGDDEQIKKKREYWHKKYEQKIEPQSINKSRFIDNQELKYSLRSVEKYAPWINNIFIITDNQKPEWLDTSHEKIHIIDHSEIMPAGALPTFNSSAIETCIHNIKNLSEYFLLANDDTFFTRPASREFFYTEKNYPIFRVRHKLKIKDTHPHVKTLINAYKLIEKQFGKKYYYDPHHSIDPYIKSDMEECNNLFKNEILRTTYSKFRNVDNISRVIYLAYACSIGKGKLKLITKVDDNIPFYQKLQKFFSADYHKDSIYFHACNTDYKEKISKYKPELICINDNEDTTNDDRIRMQKFLNDYFPEKSQFEL